MLIKLTRAKNSAVVKRLSRWSHKPSLWVRIPSAQSAVHVPDSGESNARAREHVQQNKEECQSQVIGAVLKTVVGRKVAWVRILLLPLKKCKVAQWKSRALLMLWLQVRILPLQLNATLV